MGAIDNPSELGDRGHLGDYYDEFVTPEKDKFLATLSDEQREMFEKYEEKMNFWQDSLCSENFRYGFKLGAQIVDAIFE